MTATKCKVPLCSPISEGKEKMTLVEKAKKNVSRAKGRLTRAKNKGYSLSVLIELKRDIEKAKAFERKVFQYQHSLEDAGITELDAAALFLRKNGINW